MRPFLFAALLCLVPLLAHGQDSVRQIDIVMPDSLGVTWFAPLPGEPGRAVASVHSEWNSHQIHLLEATSSGWTLLGVAPFSGQSTDRAPRFDPAGRLLFSSRRDGGAGDWDLWSVDRTGDGWGRPELLPLPVNTPSRDYHGSLARSGAIYFVSTRPGSIGEGDIFRAFPTEGGYEVTHLPGAVNTPLWEVDVFVDPAEAYIIFARTDDPNGVGGDDLFVSFRQGSAWSDPQLLPAPVNTPSYEFGAQVSPDGERLFFTSTRSGTERIYEAPVSILRALRPPA